MISSQMMLVEIHRPEISLLDWPKFRQSVKRVRFTWYLRFYQGSSMKWNLSNKFAHKKRIFLFCIFIAWTDEFIAYHLASLVCVWVCKRENSLTHDHKNRCDKEVSLCCWLKLEKFQPRINKSLFHLKKLNEKKLIKNVECSVITLVINFW